jgi:hypothetical protein
LGLEYEFVVSRLNLAKAGRSKKYFAISIAVFGPTTLKKIPQHTIMEMSYRQESVNKRAKDGAT